ncbi:MAG: N-acetyl-gamma-glutamyl-phosphate reductase [Candidatus Omnitrophica bacterium]|nr:N-acetyl-gamma-glutamyl-phosphate reductase [Candidatus Omnitrophota bacterium]
MKIKVGIVGVTGYVGQELLRILLRHPAVSVEYLGSRQLKKPAPAGELLPSFRGTNDLKVHPFRITSALDACELLFLALPHGIAMELAPQILRKRTARIVDLSADFRLRSAGQYQQTYRLKHKASPLLREAVYGLPEWNRDKISRSRLVANPGCYPTAVLLGLAPLAKERLLKREGLTVDAKSGATGAGRSLKEDLLFCEVNENLRAYRVNAHQHIPEMEQQMKELSGAPIRMSFVPHFVPINRGLYATIYAPLSRPLTERQLRSIYRKWYSKEPFVRLLPERVWPQVKSVAGSNRCEIGLQRDRQEQRALIITAIDNLGKGAAGQAVQNMNLLCGLEETEGLLG